MTAASPDVLSQGTPARRAANDRLGRLADRVAGLRSRSGSGIQSWDRWLLLGGAAAFGTGLLLVVLGWRGASRTVLLFEQIPYLLSGGLLGLGLIVTGGFVYWSYWQTVLVREARVDRDAVQERFARLEDLLERVLAASLPDDEIDTAPEVLAPVMDHAALGGPATGTANGAATARTARTTTPARRATPTRTARVAAVPPAAGSTRVGGSGASRAASNGKGPMATRPGAGLVATPRGSMVHRPDCVVVERREDLRGVDPQAPGLTACRLCEPFEQD